MQTDNNHQITLTQRKTVSVTAVDSVKAFSDTRIELCLVGGASRLYIFGSDLKITDFSKQNGTFTADGTIDSFRYGGGLKSRIFK